MNDILLAPPPPLRLVEPPPTVEDPGPKPTPTQEELRALLVAVNTGRRARVPWAYSPGPEYRAEMNPVPTHADAIAGLCHTPASLRKALLANPMTIFDFRRGFRSWPEEADLPVEVVPEDPVVSERSWRVTPEAA